MRIFSEVLVEVFDVYVHALTFFDRFSIILNLKTAEIYPVPEEFLAHTKFWAIEHG